MTLLIPLIVVLAAGALTGITGFGFSVASVPLLTLTYGPRDVVVIVLCLVPITSAAVLLAPDLRLGVRGRICWQLGAFSVVGLPVGVALFHRTDASWLTILMGAVLIAFAAFSLISPSNLQLPRGWAAPSGILGGVLATSTGLSGPAVAMYMHGRRLSHTETVATMSVYVGSVSLMGLAVMAAEEQVPMSVVTSEVSILAPAALVGVGVGRWWAHHNHHLLDRAALYALGLMGAVTLLRELVR